MLCTPRAPPCVASLQQPLPRVSQPLPRLRVRAAAAAVEPDVEAAPAARDTCRRCGRAICLCAHLPNDGGAETKTAFVVVQSRHEYFNANSTGRLAQLGLRNCRLVWDSDNDEVVAKPPLPPTAGVLFPGAGATMLGPGVGAAPPALVVIDGTWSQAKRMLRKNAWLQQLPRYEFPTRIDQPSTYRFRKQPKAHFLSTVECISRVLQAVEPGPGDAAAERLISAFDALVESQLTFSEQRGCGRTHRFHSRRRRTTPAEALARRGITAEPPRVVAYGEYLHGRLIEWVALRPVSGEVFHAFVAGGGDAPEAMQPAAFDAAWRGWLRAGELPVVWNLREDAARHPLGASAVAVGVVAAKEGGGMPPAEERHALSLKEAYAALLAARVGGRRTEGPGALEDAVVAEQGAAEATAAAAAALQGKVPPGRAAQRLALTAGMAAALSAAAAVPTEATDD